jgi:lysophospholipase L1-like esterase
LSTNYRDNTALTDAQKASLVGCATAIRTKMYGKDVRDAIASAIEMVGAPGVDSYFTPKGVKANLAALQAAYPTGTDGIWITQDDGYWNFWDGTAWERGAQYQAPENPDKSIDLNILSGKYNVANSTDSTVFLNKKVVEYQDGNVVMQDSVGLEVVKYTLNENADRIEIPLQGLTLSSIFFLGYFSVDDDIANLIKFDTNDLASSTAKSIDGLIDVLGDKLVIYQKNYKRTYDRPVNHIYVTIPTDGKIYEIRNRLYDLGLTDNKIDSSLLINQTESSLKNRSKLNQFNIQLISGSILGADANGNVQIGNDVNQKYAVVSNNLAGILVVPFYSNFATNQFICLTNDSGKVIYKISYSKIDSFDDITLTRFFSKNGDSVAINLDILRARIGDFSKIYIEFPSYAEKDEISVYQKNSLSSYDYQPWLKKDEDYPSLCTGTQWGQASFGYDTSTKKITFSGHDGFFVKTYTNPHQGKMYIPFPKTMEVDGKYDYSQAVYTLTSDGKVGQNWYYNDVGEINVDSIGFLSKNGNELEIDWSALNLASLVLILPSSMAFDYYERYEGVFSLTDVHPEYAEEKTELSDDDVIIPEYYPVTSGEDSYVFFDNILIGKNIYRKPLDIFSSNMIANKAIINMSSNSNLDISLENLSVQIPIKTVSKTLTHDDVKILCIGESTTAATDYMSALKTELAATGVNFTFLGTKNSGGIPNEAYSGWGAGTLRYAQSANNLTNSFYNPTSQQFDYDYYLQNHTDQSAPDLVLINFGINTTNRYTEKTTSQTENINFIINQIKSKNPNCIFVIGLTHSESRWSNFWSDSTRDQITKLNKQTISDFSNKESDKIFTNPMFLGIDPQWDMQYEELKPKFGTHSVEFGTSNVHPATSGYQINAYVTANAVRYALNY